MKTSFIKACILLTTFSSVYGMEKIKEKLFPKSKEKRERPAAELPLEEQIQNEFTKRAAVAHGQGRNMNQDDLMLIFFPLRPSLAQEQRVTVEVVDTIIGQIKKHFPDWSLDKIHDLLIQYLPTREFTYFNNFLSRRIKKYKASKINGA